MDITKWLNDTEVQTTPHATKTRAHAWGGAPTQTARSGPPEKEEHGTTSTPNAVNDPPHQPRGRKRKGRTLSIDSNDSSRPSGNSSQSDTSESDVPVEIFERRKRYKTREGLYEPHAGQRKRRGKRTKEKYETEGKKKQYHKTERPKKEPRQGHGLIQSFHANNVARNRLTLQPSATLGLFKKGRASSPVRGRGLPDLAFSEMRFLQRVSPGRDTPKHCDASEIERNGRNKKRRARNEEEKIAAYFAGGRQPLTEKSHVSHQYRDATCSSPENLPKRGNCGSSPSIPPATHQSIDIPTIDLTTKPFLGFGIRREGTESTTSIPWSKSASRHSSPPKSAQKASAIEVGMLKIPRLLTDDQCVPKHESFARATVLPQASKEPTSTVFISPNYFKAMPPDAGSKILSGCAAVKLVESSVTRGMEPSHSDSLIRNPRKSSSPISRLLQACDDALKAGLIPVSRNINSSIALTGNHPNVVKGSNDAQDIRKKLHTPERPSSVSSSIHNSFSFQDVPAFKSYDHRQVFEVHPVPRAYLNRQQNYPNRSIIADQPRFCSVRNDRNVRFFSSELPANQYRGDLQACPHTFAYQNAICNSNHNKTEQQHIEPFENRGYYYGDFSYDGSEYAKQDVDINDFQSVDGLISQFQLDERSLPNVQLQSHGIGNVAIDRRQYSSHDGLQSRGSEMVRTPDSGLERLGKFDDEGYPLRLTEESDTIQGGVIDAAHRPLENYLANTVASVKVTQAGRGGSRSTGGEPVQGRSFWRANRLY